jgi:hypothetical protein
MHCLLVLHFNESFLRYFVLHKCQSDGFVHVDSVLAAQWLPFRHLMPIKGLRNVDIERLFTRLWNYHTTYANDIPLESVFTGAKKFTVKEIEVFEIEN